MKKFLMFLFLIGIVFITGCGNKGLTTYHEIDYSEYKEMVNNDETFSLVIGSSTCSACSMFKPTMESFISKYQIEVRYIDISKLSEDDFNAFKSEVGFSSTPTTIFVKNGEHTSAYYRIVGSESLDNVVKAFKRQGYIGD